MQDALRSWWGMPRKQAYDSFPMIISSIFWPIQRLVLAAELYSLILHVAQGKVSAPRSLLGSCLSSTLKLDLMLLQLVSVRG
jgi:hypothetical protein